MACLHIHAARNPNPPHTYGMPPGAYTWTVPGMLSIYAAPGTVHVAVDVRNTLLHQPELNHLLHGRSRGNAEASRGRTPSRHAGTLARLPLGTSNCGSLTPIPRTPSGWEWAGWAGHGECDGGAGVAQAHILLREEGVDGLAGVDDHVKRHEAAKREKERLINRATGTARTSGPRGLPDGTSELPTTTSGHPSGEITCNRRSHRTTSRSR